MKKVILGLFIILFAGTAFAACGSAENVSTTSVVFLASEVEMKEGETTKLQVRVYPANATNQNVEFLSSDPAAVVVDEDGIITMNQSKEAIITVHTVDGGRTATCRIVPKLLPTSVDFQDDKLEYKKETDRFELVLSKGQAKALPVLVSPENATLEEIRVEVLLGDAFISVERPGAIVIIGKDAGLAQLQISGQFGSGGGNFEKTIWVRVVANPSHYILREGIIEIGSKYSMYLQDGNKEIIFQLWSANVAHQTGFSFVISNTNIFTAEVFIPDDGDLQSPMLKDYTSWLRIIPKTDGVADLFITSDAVDENGQPITRKLTITVNAEVEEVTLSTNIERTSTSESLPIAVVGETYSVSPSIFGKIAEDLYPLNLSTRKVYLFTESDAFSLFNSKTTKGITFSDHLLFSTVKTQALSQKLYVAVAKSDKAHNVNSIEWYGGAFVFGSIGGANISEQYVVVELELFARDALSGITVWFDGLEIADGIQVEYSRTLTPGTLNSLLIAESYSFFPQNASVTPVDVQISINNPLVLEYNIITGFSIESVGSCDVTFLATDGVNTFSKTITVIVLP